MIAEFHFLCQINVKNINLFVIFIKILSKTKNVKKTTKAINIYSFQDLKMTLQCTQKGVPSTSPPRATLGNLIKYSPSSLQHADQCSFLPVELCIPHI